MLDVRWDGKCPPKKYWNILNVGAILDFTGWGPV